MAFFKARADKTAVKESTGGGSYIDGSGIFDVAIERASVSQTKNGSTSLDITLINEAGNSTTFYNNIIETADGSDVDKNGRMLPGLALLNKIMIIEGLEEIDDPEEQTLKLGKDNVEKTLHVLTDLDDVQLKVQVQEEWSIVPEGYKNAGAYSRRLNIKSVFRPSDNATADEIVADAEGADVEFGAQFAVIKEKYADKVTYKDGLTAEDVAAYKALKAKGGDETPAAAAPKAAVKSKGSIFNKKK